MTTPKKTAKRPPPSFAEIGREAAKKAQREALLVALEAHEWNLAATAATLRMGDASAVIRALKALAPEDYERAKSDGRIAPGRRKES